MRGRRRACPALVYVKCTYRPLTKRLVNKCMLLASFCKSPKAGRHALMKDEGSSGRIHQT